MLGTEINAGLVGAVSGAIAVVVPVLVSAYMRLVSKVDAVHVLVNSQLSDIKAQLDAMTVERDEAVEKQVTLQADIDAAVPAPE